MKPLRRGVAYLRRSSNRQLDNHSLDIQRSQILRCAEMNGYEITDWFVDDAVSAYRKPAAKREAMRHLLTTVLEQDDVSGVFFYDESRISRQISDFVLEVYNPIREKKPQCEFYNALSGLWDPTSLVVQAQLLMAQHESAIKSSRALDAQKTLLRDPRGPRRPGASAPYGYRWDDGVLVPNEDAGIVMFIYHLASWGYSDAKIAEILNSAGMPSPKFGVWRPSTIDVMLTNPIYRGDLAWNRRKGYSNSARKPDGQYDLFEGQVDGIVPRHLWDMVRQLRVMKRNTGVKFDTPNLLQGFVFCKACGVELIVKDSSPARSAKRYVHYQCPSCRNKVEATKLDNVVLSQVGREWPGRLGHFRVQARKTLVGWKKRLHEIQEQLNAELEEAKYQRAMLSSSVPYTVQWRKIIDLRESVATEKLRRTVSLLEDVSKLEDPAMFDAWLQRFMQPNWTETLSPSERRTFCFFVLERVDVEFSNLTKVSIRYRLSPFINLEENMENIRCITEMDGNLMGEKPNVECGA